MPPPRRHREEWGMGWAWVPMWCDIRGPPPIGNRDKLRGDDVMVVIGHTRTTHAPRRKTRRAEPGPLGVRRRSWPVRA